MSAKTIEWLAVAIFFTCFFGLTIVESAWLNKKYLVPFGKAFAYTFATNTFSTTIGFFVSFVIFALLLALASDGTIGQLSGNDWRIWASVVTAAAFPLVMLILAKRLGLRLFNMDSVNRPWLFSTAASIVFLAFVTAIPVLFIYFSA